MGSRYRLTYSKQNIMDTRTIRNLLNKEKNLYYRNAIVVVLKDALKSVEAF